MWRDSEIVCEETLSEREVNKFGQVDDSIEKKGNTPYPSQVDADEMNNGLGFALIRTYHGGNFREGWEGFFEGSFHAIWSILRM